MKCFLCNLHLHCRYCRNNSYHYDIITFATTSHTTSLHHFTARPLLYLRRLCADAAEVKQDPFFSSVCWDTLLSQPACWQPRPADSADTSYFQGQSVHLPTCPGARSHGESVHGGS